MKKRSKVILILSVFGALAVVAIGAFVVFGLFGKGDLTVDSLEEYLALCETDAYYPPLPEDDCNNCDQLEFHYEQHLWMLSSERWYRMIITCDEQAYAEQQKSINERYDFASGATDIHTGEYAPDFSFGGFEFKTVKLNIYPKTMLFIGFNTQEQKICYLYFEDYELDTTDDFPVFFHQHKFLPA